MDLIELLPLFMFPTLLLFLLVGYPVAFTLSGVGLLFAGIGIYFDVFLIQDLGFLPMRIFGIMKNFTLLAVPLFIFMGIILEKSGIAEKLLESVSYILRNIKGSLYFSVILVGAVLAASTGIVGATVVTMGVLTLPTMLKNNYDKDLSLGVIAASGTLGQIIPPSIVLILLGDMMNVDIGDLFLGALVPGSLLVLLYFFYCYIRILKNPSLAPDRNFTSTQKIDYITILKNTLPPLLLIILVLGSILLGFASPTESASLGALGAMVIAFLKGNLPYKTLFIAAKEASMLTAMVFTILIGAQLFGIVFRGLDGDSLLTNFILEHNINKNLLLIFLMALLFILGFFLDFMEICFIVIPIMLPIFTALEYDMLWLSILIAINLQTSFLTPPFGFALFYLKGVTPKEIKTTDIYKGVLPFIGIQVFVLILLTSFPILVTWLPTLVFAE